jgi:hypothetical protein
VPLTFAVAAAAAACSSTSYNTDFDPAAPYASYQTYEWLDAVVPSAEIDRGLDPLVERRFVNRIESELEGKGYQKPTSGAPDFVVNFRLTTQEKIDVRSYYGGWGYYPYGGMQTHARQWTEGTLLIEVIDVRAEQVVWQGWAKGALQRDMSPEQVTQAVDEVVTGILKRFPPTTE